MPGIWACLQAYCCQINFLEANAAESQFPPTPQLPEASSTAQTPRFGKPPPTFPQTTGRFPASGACLLSSDDRLASLVLLFLYLQGASAQRSPGLLESRQCPDLPPLPHSHPVL